MRPATIPVRLDEVAYDLAQDRATPRAATSLARRGSPLASPAEQLRLLKTVLLHTEFDALAGTALRPARLEIFQVNLGKLCNMTCRHCHVDAGPDRTAEMMSRETVDLCLAALDRSAASTVDITAFDPARPGS